MNDYNIDFLFKVEYREPRKHEKNNFHNTDYGIFCIKHHGAVKRLVRF